MDWGEIIQKVYGYKLEELEKHLKDKSEEMKEFIQVRRGGLGIQGWTDKGMHL